MSFDDLTGISTAFDKAGPAVEQLKELQAAYDEVGWRVSEPATAKFRHICLHMMTTVAHFSHLAERHDHRADDGEPVTDEELTRQLGDDGLMLAELLFNVLQVANLGEVDLADALSDLYARNAEHFAPESAFARLNRRRYHDVLTL